MNKKVKILNIRPAGDDHQVVTAQGGHKGYRRTPCKDCPWKVESNGIFPAEAFRHSASTSYDMADSTFACHDSGVKGGHTCAGFLLHGADQSVQLRDSFQQLHRAKAQAR